MCVCVYVCTYIYICVCVVGHTRKCVEKNHNFFPVLQLLHQRVYAGQIWVVVFAIGSNISPVVFLSLCVLCVFQGVCLLFTAVGCAEWRAASPSPSTPCF